MIIFVVASLGMILADSSFNGRLNQLSVPVPRIEAQVNVDGSLEEPAWRAAARLTGFSQFSPVDGRPADDSTEVLVWYSPTAIHFGVRAFEAHGTVNATLADRDRIDADDYIQILLDTFNDRRQASVFSVNPLGVQADGTINEAIGSSGHGARQDVNLSPDFVYQSRGRLTPYGYEVEIRIPFKSLRYKAEDPRQWGMNIVRQVQHSGYQDTWTPARRGGSSFLAQSGTLTGLTDLRRGLVLDLNPELTSRTAGAPAESRSWRYSTEDPQLGGNVRWGVTNNLTLNGTVRPDFSQVEADVAQIQYDPRNALFYPEKRPFFLDGLEQFETPNRLIYTRRVVQPDAAVKLTGKVSGTNIGFMSALDGRLGSRTREERPLYNLLRVRRDVGRQSTIGATYTDKIDGEDYNRVAGVDARVVMARLYTLRLNAAASVNRAGTDPFWGRLLEGSFQRNGRGYGFRAGLTAIHQDFRAGSGFISRPGIANGSIENRLTRFGKPGALLESWTGSFVLNGTWDYDSLFAGGPVGDRKYHFNNNFTLRGGWRVGGSVFIESFLYPPSFYASYVLERTTAAGTDTIPFVGTHRLPNLDLVFNVNTPEWSHFSAGADVITGYDENFAEWSGADIIFINADLNWRPTEKLRISGLYSHQQFKRRTDGSTVGVRRVPRVKVEYQVTRPVFVRLVGQYDSNFQDALRDDSRTNYPILIRTAGGFRRATRFESNDFRVDWLFSYQPTPGTVFFAGYGRSMNEADALALRDLRRYSDGFFLKLTYLFRV